MMWFMYKFVTSPSPAAEAHKSEDKLHSTRKVHYKAV